MSEYVTDTHVLHWHLTGDSRLSPTARQLLTEADAGLHISAGGAASRGTSPGEIRAGNGRVLESA
jgi:hypothetical protein